MSWRGPSTVRRILWATLLLAPAANASDLCSDLQRLMSQLNTGILFEEMGTLSGAESCKPVLSLGGGRTYHCSWKFPYRSDAANRAFEDRLRTIESCIGDGTEMTQDQGVNHPDFYDLREYQFGEGKVSISIKDKGGLQNTYVFIAVTGRVPR